MSRARLSFPSALRPLALAVLTLLAAPVRGEAQDPGQAGYLTDATLLRRALAVVTERTGAQARLMSLKIQPARIVVQVHNPDRPRQLDEWEVKLPPGAPLDRDRVRGPRPVAPPGHGPDVAGGLFPLEEVDLAALPGLLAAAVERAAMRDPAVPVSAVLDRSVALFPTERWGGVRWSIDVASGSETATIKADPAGRITSTDLSGTQRIRDLDLLARGDERALREAHAMLLGAVGPGRSVYELSLGRRSATVKAVLPGAPGRRETLIWDAARGLSLDNLARPFGFDPSRYIDTDLAPFSLTDVDMAVLGSLRARAREALGMPGGHVTGISVKAETGGHRRAEPRWRIEVSDVNGEKGSITAGMTGEIHSVALPEGRRRPVDHLSPAGVTAALAEVRRAFSDDGALMAVVVDRNGPEVVVADPRAPGRHVTFAPKDGEWIRVSSGGRAYGFAGSFRAGELGALTEDRVRLYRGRTVSRMARSGGDVFRVTIQRREAAGERSVLTTEVRSGTPRGDEAGWIVFGPKGEELEVVRP